MENSLILFLTCPPLLFALVEDTQVAAGSATIEQPDAKTQLIHAADKTAINCKRFNVGKDETVYFVQPGPKAKVLCRVTGKEASIIEGNLKADGRLFIVNPSSIYFRETAKIGVHSLIATTLNISDEDFVKGNHRFFLEEGAKDSVIVNKAQIAAAQDVVFMAPQILNRGVIKAALGRVECLGGELITLNFEGDNLISFAIDEPLKKGFIEQAGKIESGQEVLLKLRVADEMIRKVVNVDGLEPATQMQFENGKVYLVAKNSIAAPSIKAEGPLLETAGDFSGVSHLELSANKEIQVMGGTIKSKLGPGDAVLKVGQGVLTIDGALTYAKDLIKDKEAPKSLTLSAKIIDQNAVVKSNSPMTYCADMILLSADVNVPNSTITFNGPVVIDGDNVKIASGRSIGDIQFNSTLDADKSSCNLTIFNGAQSAAVIFKEPIGSKGPFSTLSIETGKTVFSNIGDRHRPAAEKLIVKSPTADLLGPVIHAKEQEWEVPQLSVKSGQTITFIAHDKPLIFAPVTHVFLSPQTNVAFETSGGPFQIPKLTGGPEQSVSVSTGHGDSTIGELSGKLGPLHVQSRNIYSAGKMDVGTIFMEAHEDIGYAADLHGKKFQYELLSEGEVTLNAKHGMVGTKEFPLLVKSKGKLYLGAKSYAHVDGYFAHGFPYVYKKNPPPRTVYQGIETQYVFNEEIFMEEEEIQSLTPDLAHLIPYGFVDGSHFSFRRAPIYFTQGDRKIADASDDLDDE
ncbi:MAG TPA: filamentous hemagglutinin N-terminal domain-containing protein [Rhabdochlamydiaceae bacterium]|jgi:filamentous hemagglutinin family protein|nr:filamentous hemagglutinin N-terminal domain-containing protein [Rhabdochlamydiaceae bacterium]